MQIRTPLDLGLVIRDRRRKLKLSQTELARKAGVGRQWVVAIERGKTRAELGLVLRTLAALDLGIIYGSAQAPEQSGRGTVTTSTGSRIVRNASSGVISGRMMMSSILDQTARESWALPYIIPLDLPLAIDSGDRLLRSSDDMTSVDIDTVVNAAKKDRK